MSSYPKETIEAQREAYNAVVDVFSRDQISKLAGAMLAFANSGDYTELDRRVSAVLRNCILEERLHPQYPNMDLED